LVAVTTATVLGVAMPAIEALEDDAALEEEEAALDEDELMLTLELLPAPAAALLELAAELPPPHPESVAVSVVTNAMIASAEPLLVLRPMSLPLCELCLILARRNHMQHLIAHTVTHHATTAHDGVTAGQTRRICRNTRCSHTKANADSALA